MRNQSRLILAFIAGAAAGAAVAFLVTSEKGEELVHEIRDLAGKIRDSVAEKMGQSTEEDIPEGEEFMGV